MREAELNAKLFGWLIGRLFFFLCGDIVIVNDVLFLSSWDRHSISFSLRRLLHFLNRAQAKPIFCIAKGVALFRSASKNGGLKLQNLLKFM